MSKVKVLLVDDEEDYVRTMAERLEMRDVPSRVATSGAEALKMVQAEAPDVMVLDLRMPGIDGMQVLERVKDEHPQVQVIILTGHGSDKEEQEARALGAFEYLQKPADTAQLLDTITAAWKRGLKVAAELLRDSKRTFDRTMEAAAWAEAGVTDMAVEALEVPARAPEAPEKAASATPQAAPTSRPGALKVLLVDDEEDYVRTMAERMGMRDLGSDVALTGERALEMIEDDVPDVMVLDLRMPGMGGLEVLASVKERHPEVEVILLTGFGTDEDEREARRLGAYEYLRKPVDISELVSIIRRAGRAHAKGTAT
jgi:two-component system response regulator (stage 0 sporulation protein F)